MIARMGQRTIVELIDDIDGTIIADGRGRTVTFGLNGTTYEIDLTDENATELESVMHPYVIKARRTSGPARTKPKQGRSKEQTQAIRAWAIKNGYTLSERGRIPVNIEAHFHEVEGRDLSAAEKKKVHKDT